jgi:hypothetical protein
MNSCIEEVETQVLLKSQIVTSQFNSSSKSDFEIQNLLDKLNNSIFF